MAGAALLQLVTRLAIPLGVSITSAIWSSRFPTPKDAVTNLDTFHTTTLQLPYLHVFIAVLSFGAVAVIVAPFARLGKLGAASTATNPSLPLADICLKSLNLDGGVGWEAIQQNNNSITHDNILTRFKSQSRRSSLLGTSFNNDWRRTSAGAALFHLPRGGGSRLSKDATKLGLECGTSDDGNADSQRTSTAAMTERVIWLVCEECGASKRMVEVVGDPDRYFYDSN